MVIVGALALVSVLAKIPSSWYPKDLSHSAVEKFIEGNSQLGKPKDVTVTLSTLDTDVRQPDQDAGDDAAPAGPASAALLGLQVTDLAAAERERLGLKAGEGVRIAAVNGSSAREARLSPGLVILRVGRVPVGSAVALNRELAGYKKGDVVMLLVTSGQATSYVAVKAGD